MRSENVHSPEYHAIAPKGRGSAAPEDQGNLRSILTLHTLWAKIAQDPPPRPFRSDGCSLWVDTCQGVSIYPACFLHDLKYWAGYPGEEVARLIADAELMIDVARLLEDIVMAEVMFRGVRVGGHEIFKRPFSWGFGRQRRPAPPCPVFLAILPTLAQGCATLRSHVPRRRPWKMRSGCPVSRRRSGPGPISPARFSPGAWWSPFRKSEAYGEEILQKPVALLALSGGWGRRLWGGRLMRLDAARRPAPVQAGDRHQHRGP